MDNPNCGPLAALRSKIAFANPAYFAWAHPLCHWKMSPTTTKDGFMLAPKNSLPLSLELMLHTAKLIGAASAFSYKRNFQVSR